MVHCSLDWAVKDSALYNEAFVGQAKFIARCKHCLSEYHGSENCPEFSQPLLNTTAYVVHDSFLNVKPAVLPSANEVCRKFNNNRCTHAACKYKHTCLKCGYPHPAVFCGNQRGNRFRDRSPQSDRRNHQPGRPAVPHLLQKTERTKLTVDIAIIFIFIVFN